MFLASRSAASVSANAADRAVASASARSAETDSGDAPVAEDSSAKRLCLASASRSEATRRDAASASVVVDAANARVTARNDATRSTTGTNVSANAANAANAS